MAHEHKAVREAIEGYRYSVASAPMYAEPRAAGGICTVETCECGYQRRTNSNGKWTEQGPWSPTIDSDIYWAKRAPRHEHLEEAKSKGLAVVAVWARGVALLSVDRSVTEVSWEALREAAKQSDAKLATIYSAALQSAEAKRPPGTYW